MAEMNSVRAPYNFVPFSNQVMLRYQDPAELPPHDNWDPALKSGEIYITLEAQTPVLVSSGQDKQNARFFQTPDGTYQIPGSTVRGLLRQTMQILGFGHIRAGEDVEDISLFFRDVASKKGAVGGVLRQYYHTVMQMEAVRTNGTSLMIPKAVQSGYLHRKGSRYFIQPTVSEVLRVPRTHPDVGKLGEQYANTTDVFYLCNGRTVSKLALQMQPGWKRGVLLCTGRPVGKKPNPLYLFPEEDLQADPVPLSEEDVLSYQIDWENRSNILKPNTFWKLPKDGESKPVFYLRYESHTYFGMSRMLRIAHRHSVCHGLPPRHAALSSSQEPVLDYPNSILGYARKASAYRSRVSVGDFCLIGNPKFSQAVSTVLGAPKPSFYAGYIKDGKHYSEETFQLRGHKFYWHKKEAKAAAHVGTNERIGTTLHPLAAGSTFQGVIRYKNLHPDELGLLLWCLRLEPGCFHGIGMGKPYGFGRMKLSIDRLLEWDPRKLYSLGGLSGTGYQASNTSDAVETYIRTYYRYVAQHPELYTKYPKANTKPIDQWPLVRDFMCLRSAIREGNQVEYMSVNEFRNCTGILPEVSKERERLSSAVQSSETPEQSMKDALAALKNKYKPL